MQQAVLAAHYRFRQAGLLQQALTHRSHSATHNERLEFLGDGVLNCVIADQLFQRFSSLPEGDLSRLRAQLVRQETLHQLALKLQIGSSLKLGEGELRSGGAERPSILADALEAVFGAVYLDGGFEAVHRLIASLYAELLDALDPAKALKDPKTRLQEWLQARKKALPNYTLHETTGAAHAQCFTVACEIVSPKLRTLGEGASRRAAEQEAARLALEAIEK
ncbi:MAG TPA: ribonuclease III [Rhodocyclaceae bacterium]|nr:ribonuclease III [Rhodocyclaceae bacterium]